LFMIEEICITVLQVRVEDIQSKPNIVNKACYKRELFTHIPLAFDSNFRVQNNLMNSLQSYFKAELLNGNEQYACEGCKLKVDAEKQISLDELPEFFVFQIKRFEYIDGISSRKINEYFSFPRDLSMKQFISPMHAHEKNTNYKLAGIVNHDGVSLAVGHYYSFIFNKLDDQWYLFNDTSVTRCPELHTDIGLEEACFGGINKDHTDYLTATAYMLFYERVIQRPLSVINKTQTEEIVSNNAPVSP
ncbi:unnamed protein product, partial [Didymodactylos carnosus]